nr:ribonuclease H-like domain-containing protein [Tanacetum cinerariifolium]
MTSLPRSRTQIKQSKGSGGSRMFSDWIEISDIVTIKKKIAGSVSARTTMKVVTKIDIGCAHGVSLRVHVFVSMRTVSDEDVAMGTWEHRHEQNFIPAGPKKEKAFGTGSESDGLNVFDKEYNKSVVSNQSKFFVCHVSKEIWHNRLGHPANPVLKLLKGSPNLTNVNHNGPIRDVKFYETLFPYKTSNQNEYAIEFSKIEISNLNFFDYVESETIVKACSSCPIDDEEGPSGRDGSVHQIVSIFLNQFGHDEQHTATPIGEKILSKGNVGSNQEVPIFKNVSKNQTEEDSPGLRRSHRPSKLPAKLNDFLLDNKLGMGCCNTLIKSQRIGIPLGMLLHSSYTQVTEIDLKRDV